MIAPLELALGLRYIRARRRNHFISFISTSSILGIALGVTALITVLAVMSGFEKELKSRILGLASHATIAGVGGPLLEWNAAAKVAVAHPEVLGVAPYVHGEGMLAFSGRVQGTIVRGVLPTEESQVSDIRTYLLGSADLDDLQPGSFRVLLGDQLARRLGVGNGDKVTMVAPQATVTPAGILPRLKRFTVVGTFKSGHGQYDTSLALVHLSDAAKLFRLGDGVSGLRLKLKDLDRAKIVNREVALSLQGRYWVSDWTQHHANFFRALKIEKTVMFVILTLIVAVAAFNIVSTMIMVVTDKQAEIAILRTLGMSPGSVMSVFMLQGTIIGLLGTLFGAIGGLLLAGNFEYVVHGIEALIGAKILDPETYYITEVPSDIRWQDVTTVLAVTFPLCVLATVYPAWRASRTQPAEALRYE